MQLIKKLFVPWAGMPRLRREDIANFAKVLDFLNAFVEAKPPLSLSPISAALFEAGGRPETGIGVDPYILKPNVGNLVEWFVTKIFGDLSLLKDADKAEFKQFLDMLSAAYVEAAPLGFAGASHYGVNLEGAYEAELRKVPVSPEGDVIRQGLLDEDVLAAEMLILVRLYEDYFKERYEMPKYG